MFHRTILIRDLYTYEEAWDRAHADDLSRDYLILVREAWDKQILDILESL